MKKLYKTLNIIILMISINIMAQEEFNAIVTVNSDKVQSSNKQIFKTLENSLTEFINQTKWTDKKVLSHERINCAFTIIINEMNGNNFSGSLQVQAMRPVYNSTYETPILNINDTEFNFSYIEFQPLNYNKNTFDGNLISTVVFYLYNILGVDADTYTLNGGVRYFKTAESIMRLAQQEGGDVWQDKMGEQNRYAFIDGFTSSNFSDLHKVLYQYHRKGLDVFESDELTAKKEIANSLFLLKNINNIGIGSYMLRVFLDAKTNEIVNIFSAGKRTNQEIKIQETLQKIAPTQSTKWTKIK